MLIDAFQIMSIAGFPIRDYQYSGMGSIYFVDYIMLHRLLGMTRFLTAEFDRGIRKRVKFNRPFKDIAIRMDPIGDVIPDLDVDLKHILWLDYDFRMRRLILEDTVAAAHKLSPGSILLITVDVEPPTEEDNPAVWMRHFQREARPFTDYRWTASSFARSRLAHVNATILFNAVRNGIAGRKNIKFFPLFKFDYADGHEMITVGGMIGGSIEERMLAACDFSRSVYIRPDFNDEFYHIRVPRITRKERLHLDHFMPSTTGWKPREFELPDEDLESFRQIYRYYPAYAELLL
jgi:hypothetical protein